MARHIRAIKCAAILSLFSTVALLAASPVLFVVLGLATLSVFFAIYILLIANGAEEGRWFRAGWLLFLGRISYCLYLIHQPIANALHGLMLGSRPDIGSASQVAVTLLAFAVSVCVASLSWICIEAPLIGLGRRWHYGMQPAW